MSNRDWSLVFFTSLAQWSVGIILWLCWPVIHNQDLSPIYQTGLGLNNPVLLALLFIGGATLSSFLHLGNPVNAPNALNNLKGSWLSREILAIGAYGASLVFTLLVGWTTSAADYLKFLLVLNSVSGLALLWTMSKIYVMPTIPAWNSWYTPLSFVSCSLSLGVLTMLTLDAINSISIAGHIVRIYSISLITILLIEFVSAFIHQHKLASLEQAMAGPVFDKGLFYQVFLVRVALLVFTLQLMIVLAFIPELLPLWSYSQWLFLLFLLVITQELMGRLLFYSSYFRLGV